ncbi:ATPase-like protein, partial [Coemansia sp. S142-1]
LNLLNHATAEVSAALAITSYITTVETISYMDITLLKSSIRSLTMFAGTVAGLNSKLMHFRANKVGLQEFLDADSANYIERSSAAGDLAVDLNECVFSWGTDTYSLAPATLQVKAGNFITVVGCIGSGKSSFLSAICGEMPLTSGQGCVYGRVGYVEQKPWIMNATFCDNVPMGADFDKVYFLQVIDACALAADVGLFPKGDLTMIGTNGVNLSGGQKVRLALASIISHKTQILVTQAEHLVLLSDTVITFVDGKMSIINQVPLTLSTFAIAIIDSKDTMSSSDSANQQASVADIYSKPFEYRKLDGMWSAIWHFIQLSGYGTSLQTRLMTDSDPATMVQSLKYYLLVNVFVLVTRRQIYKLEEWIRRTVLTTRLEYKMR